MSLDVTAVFEMPGQVLPLCFVLPASYDELPFASPPLVTAKLENRAGIVSFFGEISLSLSCVCDRCAVPMTDEARIPFRRVLVTTLAQGENDTLTLVDAKRFLPEELVWEEIVLGLPPQHLCQEACRGLCALCGKNWNEASCACVPEMDSRLAALRNWSELTVPEQT